MTTEKKILTK